MPNVNDTLAERGSRYGDFADNARVAQELLDVLLGEDGWHNLPTLHRQALCYINEKISRIICGDPNYADNWHDIQGYARLVEERLHNAQSPDLTDDQNPSALGRRRTWESHSWGRAANSCGIPSYLWLDWTYRGSI